MKKKIIIDFNTQIKHADGKELEGEQNTFAAAISKTLAESGQLKALSDLKAWEISKSLANGEVLELDTDEFNKLKREIENFPLVVLVKAPAIITMNEAYAKASTTKE